MKKYGILPIAALLVTCLLAGCASGGPKVDPNQIAHDFYNQRRTYSAVTIEGLTEITMRGEDMLIQLEAPLPELRMLPSDPNTIRDVGEIVKNVLLGGLGIYTLGQVATRDPVVVTQPEPLIVRPEVVSPTVVGGGVP